jgi:hypothetical protein
MRFGGHETFAIREGWLHKGLRLLADEPHLLADEHAADWLGVGRNMAKSIRHWLLATGLAEAVPDKPKEKPPLEATALGRLVWQHDRYFTEVGTWWALHVNLVNTPEHAASWAWFFNSFGCERFERALCLESLTRHLQLSNQRLPNRRTLERDVACLLASYARTIPPTNDDPEEGYDCPFRELRLLTYFRTSGYYQLHQGVKDVPAELLGYAIAKSFPDATRGSGAVDVTVHDAARQAGGPGRAFALTSEALFELASRAETSAAGRDIEISGLAGNRLIRVTRRPPIEWIERYYETTRRKDRHVA